jgi:hypothetical protein
MIQVIIFLSLSMTFLGKLMLSLIQIIHDGVWNITRDCAEKVELSHKLAH